MMLTRKVALAAAGIVTAGVLGTAGVAAATGAPVAAASSGSTATAETPTASSGNTATAETPAASSGGTAAAEAPAASSGTAAGKSATPSGSAAAGKSAAPGGRAGDRKVRPPLRGRGLHGEWVVKGKDGQPVRLASVRGTVTAVGPAGVTVEAEDGYTATFAVTADTRVRGAGVDSITDVAVGATVAVVGVGDGTSVTARVVVIRT